MLARGSIILVIDDDELIREILTAALQEDGYAVKQASNGKDVLKLVKEHSPSLIITDILMPDCDGLEILQTLRAEERRPKVIVISGGGLIPGETCLHLADAFGADAVLAKPFRHGQLMTAIDSLAAG